MKTFTFTFVLVLVVLFGGMKTAMCGAASADPVNYKALAEEYRKIAKDAATEAEGNKRLLAEEKAARATEKASNDVLLAAAADKLKLKDQALANFSVAIEDFKKRSAAEIERLEAIAAGKTPKAAPTPLPAGAPPTTVVVEKVTPEDLKELAELRERLNRIMKP